MGPIASSRKTSPEKSLEKKRAFNVKTFLDSAGVSRRVVSYRKLEKIYSQGDPAEYVMYIQKGGVRISVVNATGKEAVVGILGPGDFFGEGGLAGQSIRMATATRSFPLLYW
jgi:CRP/FNR family cyclic AMP-dependent transcriptional regulator